MTINFRHPKYLLPLIALPFLCLFFYVYHSSASKKAGKVTQQQAGLNGTVADVSPDVKKRSLEDKLDAYRDRYKEAAGNSAVSPITADQPAQGENGLNNTARQQRQLDSIDQLMKQRFSSPSLVKQPPDGNLSYVNSGDAQLTKALNSLSKQQKRPESVANAQESPQKDPMDLFKRQMAYLDSVRKASDPAWQKQQQEAKWKAEAQKTAEKTLTVTKAVIPAGDFNTVRPEQDQQFITAVIDENVTGYAGSRIRLRLLEPVMAGKVVIPKDTYLYAIISSFSGQRVALSIRTILLNGQLLPVKLEVYDQDGLPGLYVPDSQFRDFTKNIGTSTMQGVPIDNTGSSAGSQFLMSTAGKLFESTSTAIASAIRKNKAKIKYNAYVYLIDTKNLNQP